jgi:cbb3-type cytochrome oxidase maturation protein
VEIIIILIPLALLLSGCFIYAFIWSTKKGQYDDLETPRFRMLLDDEKIQHTKQTASTIKDGK